MQIDAIELENTKSYDRALIEFTPGVNAIVGHNGAGKSTILEAIGLAVFDAINYKQSEFVRGGAKSATITVTLLSSLDERRYQIVRRIGSSNQHYVYDPELQVRLCEGKADVLAFLRQHLGVERSTDLPALFHDAVGVSQGTFTAVFLESAGRRKPVFDTLLQVDEYQTAVEKLLEPLRLLRSRRQELDVESAGIKARSERLPALEEAITHRVGEIHSAQTRLAVAVKQLAAAQKQREDLDAIRNEVTALQHEHVQAGQRLEGAASRVVSAQQALDEAEEARAAVAQSEAGFQSYLGAQAQQQDLDAQARQRQKVESQRAAADKAVALSEAALAKLEHELEAIRAAEETVERLRVGVKQQTELDAALLTARQQDARLQDAQAQAASQRNHVARLEKRYAELKLSHARAKELDAERIAVAERITQSREALDGYKDASARYRAEAESLKQQTKLLENEETAICPVCEQQLSPQHRRGLLAR